jgi:tripartite-type tricarboxylate transporter receptor subunit TctC
MLRTKMTGVAIALLLISPNAPAAAAEFPTKPIRWVVPFPAGGAVDAIARIVARKMTQDMAQPVVVENRGGSGGIIGTEAVTKSPPDGYTILINSTGLAVDKWFYPQVPYDSRKDLAPVILLASLPSVLVVPASSPVQNAAQLIAMAKANPGKITYASAGLGTSIHLASALLAARAGVDLLHVPYKGSGPAATDLIAGRVDMMIDSVTAQRPNIESGRVRALGVTSLTSSPMLPGVPPLAQATSIPDFEVLTWCGIFVPAGTPPDVIRRLNAEMNKAVASSEVRESLAVLGVRAEGGTPDALGGLLQQETERWGKLIVDHHLNVN